MTLLLTTLALLAPGTGGEEGTPGISLSTLLQSEALDSLRVGGLLRGYAVMADDELSAVANEDVQAVRLNDAQLWFSAAAIQAHIVLRATCTRCRAKMRSRRYSGK